MSELTNEEFQNRYGPWAIISGASEGVGADLSREIASKGVNCVLVARRMEKLQALAKSIEEEFGVKTLCKSIDLMNDDAADQLEAIADEVDVGLYIVNAGGDTVASRFIESDFSAWQGLIGRNIVLLSDTLHRFAKRFAKRGSGGLAVVGSDAGFNGAGRVSVYAASKGYALNLIESIWAELQPKNVDAVFLAIGSTDTPKLRGLMELRGVPEGSIHLAPTDALAKWAVSVLHEGPTQVYEVDPASMDPLTSPVARRKRVERNTRIIDFFFGDLEGEGMLADLKSGRSWK